MRVLAALVLAAAAIRGVWVVLRLVFQADLVARQMVAAVVEARLFLLVVAMAVRGVMYRMEAQAQWGLVLAAAAVGAVRVRRVVMV